MLKQLPRKFFFRHPPPSKKKVLPFPYPLDLFPKKAVFEVFLIVLVGSRR